MATVCGIGAANHEYACIWCKCPRLQRGVFSKQWSLNNPELGARSIEEIIMHARSKKFNCKFPPLFPFISLDHVIIDTLHLFLRIADNLIELLIQQLKQQDALDKNQKFTGEFLRQKFKHMAAYESFLQNLGISFQWRVNPDTKKLDYRDLTGPEKLILFQHINIADLLPNSENKIKIKDLWVNFMDIIGDLKLTFTTREHVDSFKDKVTSWFKHFTSTYQIKDVTPYMHALFSHVPEFLCQHNNINYFNQQGMEKYNDTSSKHYFRSSNHKGIESLKQMFLKKNRIQFLEAAGYERVKNGYKCRNCKNNGHTIKTCSAKCTHCNYISCCGHLVKIDKKWVVSCQV